MLHWPAFCFQKPLIFHVSLVRCALHLLVTGMTPLIPLSRFCQSSKVFDFLLCRRVSHNPFAHYHAFPCILVSLR
ncbi:hypothetical protein BGW80DRAFT_1346851 [Lactifluus volemus]|nr:hypothetical protein BGW80DRAFT_1346851 [Lactifluus volemus]